MSLLQRTRAAAAIHPAAIRDPAAGVPVRRIGDLDVAAVSGQEVAEALGRALDGAALTRVAFANAHCVNVAARHPAYADALCGFLLLPDGIGVDLGSRLLYGGAFPENLNGTDFVPRLLESLGRPLRVALVGGEPGIAERAAEAFARAIPAHTYLPVSDGFFRDGPETAAVLAALAAARADIVLVALGVPGQELFMARHLDERHARIAIGVGALLDFTAGKVSRAPPLVRRFRLEWAYRLALEPRRLARRYLFGNPSFLLRVLRQRASRRPASS